MWPFRKKEERAEDTTGFSNEDALLKALLGTTGITKQVAMQIPTVSSAINLISNIVASTPIKLYELQGKKAVEVTNDPRVALLNDETGDTLNAHDFWGAMIHDYYLGKGAYAYINKQKGEYKSIHYVDESYISIQKNTDPIFKDYDIMVNGLSYMPFDFLKILRNSTDGASGTGIVTENSEVLSVAYETLIFEKALVKKGGNKKGFLKSKKHLDDTAFNKLKTAYSKLYGNNSGDSENVVILNDGIEFEESSNTSVEMQLNENKETNSKELCKIFHVSPDAISGKGTENEISNIAKIAAIPLMVTIQCALNRDFLLESEKCSYYWAFDTKELLKGPLKDRIAAYTQAVQSGIMMRSEVRSEEDLPEIKGLDIISMGLADVIYDPNTQKYFTPNTKVVTDIKKGGESQNEPV